MRYFHSKKWSEFCSSRRFQRRSFTAIVRMMACLGKAHLNIRNIHKLTNMFPYQNLIWMLDINLIVGKQFRQIYRPSCFYILNRSITRHRRKSSLCIAVPNIDGLWAVVIRSAAEHRETSRQMNEDLFFCSYINIRSEPIFKRKLKSNLVQQLYV